MLDLTHWQRSYSVGNWVLDNQHQEILELCQEAVNRVPEDTGDSRVRFQRFIENELFSCLEAHFETEESYLQRAGYPALLSHRDEHQRIWSPLRDLVGVTTGEQGRTALCDFLTRWCSRHILDSDRQFADAIRLLR